MLQDSQKMPKVRPAARRRGSRMPKGMEGRLLNEMCSSRICVDEYNAGELKGRLYSNYYSEPIIFENVLQLVKKLDSLYDSYEYPQKTTKTRSFSDDPGEAEISQAVLATPFPQEGRGKRATFHVKVIFRKNATWQGNVYWLDGNCEKSFRSALELLFLMESALR